MWGLCQRSSRLRHQLTSLQRQLTCYSSESPAQQERRLAEEEERKTSIEFYSLFEMLRPSRSSTLEYFQRLNAVPLTNVAAQAYFKERIFEERVLSQRFLEERHQVLGFDLAAAHFIVARGGRVKIEGRPGWVTRAKDGRVPLPGQYTYGIHVEEIDASGTEIVYEGLENFITLVQLRALHLRDCPYVDDWCVDRVCGEHRARLHHLDLSGCRRVTAAGLEGIAQLKGLKTLTLERMDHIPLLPFICLLLEDVIPGLEIRGVDVLQPPPEHLELAPGSQSVVQLMPGSQSVAELVSGDQSVAEQAPNSQSEAEVGTPVDQAETELSSPTEESHQSRPS